MTNISLRNGRVVLKDGKVGTEQDCCKLDPFCPECEEGWLPDSITVTFSNWPEDELVEGPPLIFLTTESCASDIGIVGFIPASGKVDSPGGTAGALSAASVTSGGAGHAILGRVEPTLTISGGSGTGADLDVVLDEVFDEFCELVPTYHIESVTVNDGGSGYVYGESLTVTKDTEDTELQGAALTLFTTISAPTITATIASSGGSGATVSVAVEESPDNFNRWRVASVTITNGGTGYAVGDALEFSVDAAGGDIVDIPAYFEVASVNGSGAVQSVSTVDRGLYYNDDGVIASVSVGNAGSYFRDDASAPAIVFPVTVTATQYLPSAGTGGTLSATVDDDPASPTFGKVTGFSVSGGSGYLAYEMVPGDCAKDYWDGRVYVMKRLGSGTCCGYSVDLCNVEDGYRILGAQYYGPNEPPKVGLLGAWELVSTTNVTNCTGFSFTAVDEDGRTAVVTPGGEREPRECIVCNNCCRNLETAPCEIEAEVYPDDDVANAVTVVFSKNADREWGCELASDGPWVFLSIRECNYAPQDAENCLHCWKKCETTAFVIYGPPFNVGCTLTFSASPCQNCEDTVETPICAPQSGTYVADIIYNPSGFCSDGHAKWTVVVP